MKTTKLELDVQKFVQSLKAETSTSERVKICSNTKKELLKNHTPASAKTYLTSYRKGLVNGIGVNKHLLSFLRIPKAQSEKIKNDDRKKIQKRTEINDLHTIPNPSKLIDLAKELIKGESYLKVGLGLMLLTGRRTTEILKTAIFYKVENKVFEVVFEGQTKKGDGVNLPYKIPILAPAKEILKALEFIRKERDFSLLTNSQVNTKTANSLNEYTKQLFNIWLGVDCTPHDLRKAYITLAYEQSDKKESFRGFAEKFLGHSENSELTTETYFKYTI